MIGFKNDQLTRQETCFTIDWSIYNIGWQKWNVCEKTNFFKKQKACIKFQN
jgi:hypothetical protein